MAADCAAAEIPTKQLEPTQHVKKGEDHTNDAFAREFREAIQITQQRPGASDNQNDRNSVRTPTGGLEQDIGPPSGENA